MLQGESLAAERVWSHRQKSLISPKLISEPASVSRLGNWTCLKREENAQYGSLLFFILITPAEVWWMRRGFYWIRIGSHLEKLFNNLDLKTSEDRGQGASETKFTSLKYSKRKFQQKSTSTGLRKRKLTIKCEAPWIGGNKKTFLSADFVQAFISMQTFPLCDFLLDFTDFIQAAPTAKISSKPHFQFGLE